jgi:RNA polymerase sigma-70 factor (ECF subfamily)
MRIEQAEPGDLASLSDEGLASLARTDRRAVAVLYRRYLPSVLAFCERRLPTTEAAEDATSLVFTKAVAALPSYRDGEGSFRSWLFAIAMRVTVDVHRARRPTSQLDAAVDVVDPARWVAPDEVAEHAELVRSVHAALAALPESQREIVELRMAGLTGPEIAAVLGRSLASVKFAQFRAYQRLRQLLAEPVETEDRRVGS